MIAPPEGWSADWAWGVPIIVLTVLAHGFGLMAIHEYGLARLKRGLQRRHSATVFAAVVASTALVLTVLHALEAIGWAIAYVALGALGDFRSAILYSLNAITSYGHDSLGLAPHWRLMGALEALNGLILFGLTTAYLFGVLQSHWPSTARDALDPHDARSRAAEGGGPRPRIR